MFVWTNGYQNPLAHTHFNMFVDEWMSENESPGKWVCNPLVSVPFLVPVLVQCKGIIYKPIIPSPGSVPGPVQCE